MEKKYIMFLYLRGKDNYLYFVFTDINLNDGSKLKAEKATIYPKQLFNSASPGAIFEADFTEDTISYGKKAMPVSYWKNEDDRAEWRLLNNSAENKKKELKQIKANVIDEILEPVREAYRAADYTQKTLILAEVIRYITK